MLVSLLLGLALLCACLFFLVLRPQKPVFSLHSIQLESAFKLDVAADSGQVFLPSAIASLRFITCNPNRIGILYRASELAVLYEGVPVGVIQVPEFYQPPRSVNLTVIMHANLERVNLTGLVRGLVLQSSGGGSPGSSRVHVQVIGGVKAQAHITNFHLPSLKVGVDCNITVDYGGTTALKKGVGFLKRNQAILVSNFPHLTQKCSMALCV